MASKIHPITKVRLKWVKNRTLDHIIDRDTSIKAAVLLKNILLRSPSGVVPARSLSPLQKILGLTVPVPRFLRRYPTLFLESPHPIHPSLPAFGPSKTCLLLHRKEQEIHQECRKEAAERLGKFVMMAKSRSLPVRAIEPLKYDLGLPDDYVKSVVPEFPDLFRLVRRQGQLCVELEGWRDDLAVSALQVANRNALESPDFRRASGSRAFVAFPMSFPRGYGAMRKVKEWMNEFDNLPYISPYEDVSGIRPESEIMEKHVVGVLHEVLSLMIHKKTKRNYLRCLRGEFNLPEKFTRIFTRYPGIFYLSLKCKTTTVVLREGYRRGKLVDPHPLAVLRDKYFYVMRSGILYRGKAEEVFAAAEREKELKELECNEESEDEEWCEGTASEDDGDGSDEG